MTDTQVRAINFAEAFNSVTEYWSPMVVSQVTISM